MQIKPKAPGRISYTKLAADIDEQLKALEIAEVLFQESLKVNHSKTLAHKSNRLISEDIAQGALKRISLILAKFKGQ